jgi:Ca2+-binding RTX toxin-like protein
MRVTSPPNLFANELRTTFSVVPQETVLFTGGAGNDILMGGEDVDTYKFGNKAGDFFGKDTILDAEGKDSLQINGQTLQGTFTSYGDRGAYRLKLADGSGAELSVYNDTASSTGKSAILKFSSNLTNQITIRNFNEAAAKGGSGSQGFMGIKIDPKQTVLVKANDYATAPNPFEPWDFDPTTFAASADSAITERNGKGFTVYLQQAASAGSTLILSIAGAVGQGLKAILGDSVVDANGASIELAEGQTQVSFSLVSDSDITADQAGGITVNYQSSGEGAGSNASSNTWALTLKDAGETENTLNGDFLVKTEKADSDITRLDAQGQEIVVVKKDELFYVRDGQGNLATGSDDETVTTNAIFGGAGKDKINGLADSDLLGGFGGNDEIDGGSGADMIGGGKRSDRILGGDGDDYISSSADVIKSQQQRGKDDVWQNYGLPQGKEAISTQALWGTYKDTQEGDGVTVWAGITDTDTSRTDGDVIDAGAGDDRIDGQGGADRLFGGDGNDILLTGKGSDVAYGGAKFDAVNTLQRNQHQGATNSIARRADSAWATCSKCLRNRAKTSLKRCTHKTFIEQS